MQDYRRAVTLWLILGGGVTVGLGAARVRGSGWIIALWIVVLVMLAFRSIRLIRELRERVYYALVIETAGTPRTALVSTDGDQVSELVYQIMDAIDNPQAEYHVQVENFHVGDNIHVNGGRGNIGKKETWIYGK